MRKKHNPPKNIRTKDGRENFRYFMFEINDGVRRDLFIHLETELIGDENKYFGDKIDFIHNKYTPKLVEVEISPLGKWEYNALKQKGAVNLIELWNN